MDDASFADVFAWEDLVVEGVDSPEEELEGIRKE